MIRFKEASLGIAIIAFIVIIITRMPTPVIDFLLMLNVGWAFIIMLNALYSKEPLEMSLFPTILLVSTLFQAALNIMTLRSILLDRFAGNVVQAFGDVVAGGNLVVGVIMFTVLILFNLIVVTKGSERVSEVTARFTLDAMPGKQMAIDADLNTGLISEAEARERRKKIQDESNFYGAMDGATKYIKGNVILAIIITVVSIVGGIVMGMLGLSGDGRLPLGEAAQVYMLMSIGDGLLGAIPSILISFATGTLVTKAVGESEKDISSAFFSQLFFKPIVLYLAGAVMIFMSVFTRGLPWWFFIPFGVFLIWLGRRRTGVLAVEDVQLELSEETEATNEYRRPEQLLQSLDVDAITIYFGYGLIPLVEESQGGDLLDRVFMIRRQIAMDYGIIVPIMRFKDNIKFSPSEYKIHIKGEEVAGGEIMFDHYLAYNPGYVEEEIDGIETLEPAMGIPAMWISEGQRERAEALGYTVVDPPAIIATHLTEIIRKHMHEMLTRQAVQALIDKYNETNPVLISELVPKLMSVGEVQKVLCNLLREEISIRDMVTILETLADYARDVHDTDMLTEYVRQALRRYVSNKFFENDVNTVITLDPALEQQIMASLQQTQQGSYLALDPKVSQAVFDKLNGEVTKLTSMGIRPIILTSPVVRMYFKKLVEPIAPELVVLSYSELEPSADIQSVGMVSIA
jgi:flagellar biosynthesis protein FlhA